MDNERIEFYQNRSFGERLSAAAEFLRQNWKVFYKNILIPAIPFLLLMAYLAPQVMAEYTNMIQSLMTGDISAIGGSRGMMPLFLLVSSLFSLYLYAMSAAIMKLYEEGNLTEKTSWGDLSSKMFSNAGKIFLVGLATGLIFFAGILVFALLMGMLGGILAGIFSFLLIIGLIAAVFPMVLIIYPALFRGASTWESIKEGFSVGFKNWGTTFGIVFIVGIMAAIISYAFGVPYGIYMAFNPGEANVMTYVLSVLSSSATALVTPFMVVFIAFHYFSITEKEEGVSLQNKIDEFDNL
ncbi:MAG: hypothetical protein LBI82_06895 [Dysgonamonadaceae bacterium]|jgi:hypothetical protein|nr:hypothetical protein [Dysgonamonadaceae bacterium]